MKATRIWMFRGTAALEPMWWRVENTGPDVWEVVESYDNGFTWIGNCVFDSVDGAVAFVEAWMRMNDCETRSRNMDYHNEPALFLAWEAGRIAGDDIYSWADYFDMPDEVTIEEWNDLLSVFWGC